MNEAFRAFGDGEDFIGVSEAFVFDVVNERIPAVSAGAVELGSVDVSDKGEAKVLFGEDASFKGKPIVSVDDVGLKLH